jgi:ribonuclease HIII
MDQSKLQANLEALRAFIQNKGWTIVEEKEIQSGYQLKVTDGITRISVDFFTTGRALIQGKPGVLRSELKSWWDAQKASFPQQAAPAAIQSSFIATPAETPIISYAGKARIGLDESGKGDYFGPLVIAAVYVDEQSEPQLITVGVRDSKRLTDNRILVMAEEIKAICSYSVVPIGPKRYNELYEEFHNLNKLLAWGHARSLENLLDKVSCDLAVADQFGDESFLLNALMKKGRQIKLEQRPRAEEDIAVAAASILARAEFVRRMEQLSKRIGKTLPKGSSSPSIEMIGREIVAKGGQDELAEVAKLHFKTTAVILQS